MLKVWGLSRTVVVDDRPLLFFIGGTDHAEVFDRNFVAAL